ncbi:MAG TPA: sugar transferase [Opitutaceae bacterium]|nr:sugar transferase [Opitutaceae bacterium]
MHRNTLRQIILPATLLVGDLLFSLTGLSLAWWLRYDTSVGQLGIPVETAAFGAYLPLLLVGVALLIGTYAQLGLYDERLLLRRYQALAIIIKGTVLWLLVYLGVSLVLKFQPPISRLFVVVAFFGVVLLEYLWRAAFYAFIRRGTWLERVQQRVAVLGWNDHAATLVHEISGAPAHPFQIVGLIGEDRHTPDPRADLPALVLGPLDELASILRVHRIDILIAAHLEFPPERMKALVQACEQNYVELKVVPSVFQVFVSGLRMQTIGNVPILGVEDLALAKLFSRALKRIVDIAGACLGLALAAPVMALLAVVIRRESPGPVFFGQQRIGAGHRSFTMWKLRSMRTDAAAADNLHQSTTSGDPRVLRIGRLMRRWNLDELPQFWNVLRGEMSLVGPRPERPFHVDRLSGEIPHYLPRHLVKPGMTGWAQVNNLRGASDLRARIQHDIYYIENWSLWLDIQILLLTLVRWRNTAE